MCELDIIFHFEKAYYVLDELILCGELQETSKEDILRDVDAQDLLQEVSPVSLEVSGLSRVCVYGFRLTCPYHQISLGCWAVNMKWFGIFEKECLLW